jgi:branched-chain amino acid transport system ATP-binding protein
MDKLLDVVNLRLDIEGFSVLYGLDLTVDRGEIVGLLGENGSGKTMTLRSIVRLEEARADKLLFGKSSLIGRSTHEIVRLGLSYCPSENNVFPAMSVRENLEMGSYLEPTGIEEKISQVGRLFPSLKTRFDQRATSLSGGERQMLALGKSLMSGPELLLLDEFSLGLSQGKAIEFSDKIKSVHETGVSVLFVEQNLHLASKLAQRDYYMVEGEIVERDAVS